MSGKITKRSEEIAKKICDLLRAGNTRRTSCAVAGISEDTFARWHKDDADFAEAIKGAEETAVARNVALIQQAAQAGTWQAAAWWLERRRPADFSIKQLQEHSGGLRIEVTYADSANPTPPVSPEPTDGS